MLKVLTGQRARNFEEAAILAFEEFGINDMSIEVAGLFASILDINRLSDEADKNIKSAVHNRYGRKATWYGNQWFVPVPRLGFKTEPIPQLIMTVQPYLVSATKVDTSYSSYSLTLVGAVDKAAELAVPMIFLHAIINDDLGRFRLIAKSSSRTTWEVPSTKGIDVPNDFVHKLSQIFEQRSVTMWLESFGSQGRTVAPQVVGCLWGLESMGAAQPIPAGQQAWNEETIISALERMAYSRTEAKEMFNRVGPKLRADQTLEDVIRLTLKEGGKEG